MALAAASPASSQTAAAGAARTYCNPLDIEYRYSLKQLDRRISYRAGADPVIVRHRDA